MSFLATLTTAVAVPLCTIVVVFFWFLVRAHLAQKQKNRDNIPHLDLQPAYPSLVPVPNLNQMAERHARSVPEYVPVLDTPTNDYKPTYQPLSHYLETPSDVVILDDYDIQYDLTVIPGITKAIEEELRVLGYTCIEQIARWGRADVRAVSAVLDVEQQQIEEQWISNARLILSLR